MDTAREQLSALIDGGLDMREHAAHLFLMDHRAEIRGLVQRRTRNHLDRALHELPGEIICNAVLDEKPGAGAAFLALVENGAEQHAVQRLIKIGAGKHDVSALAAKFERGGDDTLRRRMGDLPADGG